MRRRRDSEPDPDWRTFARAFLRLKAERDYLRVENARLEAEAERREVIVDAMRSRIGSMAELDNGQGGW